MKGGVDVGGKRNVVSLCFVFKSDPIFL